MQKNDVPYVNVALGIWLIVSAFLWRHSRADFANAVAMGIVIAGSAAISLRRPAARLATTAAGVWLIASLFAWSPQTPGTIWNTFFVGAAVVLASLIGPSDADITSTANLFEPDDELESRI
jgi:hypothetical protein